MMIYLFFSRSYPEPPPYTEGSQQSISDVGYVEPSAQHHDQPPSYEQNDVFIVSASDLNMQKPVLITTTSDHRTLFIFTGISYFIWAGLAIGLEISSIIYSSSTCYEGLWAGAIMLGTAIRMFIGAYRVAHPITYTARLLIFVFFSTALGAALSVYEISEMHPCVEHAVFPFLCDFETARILKLMIVGELNFAMIHTGVNLSCEWTIGDKSTSIPPDESPPSYIY
jgi:hypothetical protein